MLLLPKSFTTKIPPRVETDDGGAVLVHGVEEGVDDVAHRAAVPQQLLKPAHHTEDAKTQWVIVET